MTQLCTNTPLPTFSSLHSSFSANLTFPPKELAFPEMPTLPSPMFPTIGAPNLEMVTTMLELQSHQLMLTMMGFIQPVIDALSLDLDAVLPTMPGLPDFNLMSLLENKADELYAAVKEMIPDLSGFYPSLGIPEMELMQKASELVKTYVASLITWLEEKISAVTDLLSLVGMPTLPSIPTIEELRSIAMNKWNEMKSMIPDFNAEASMADIFDFDIPGFPPLPKIPTPLIPSINIPEFSFELSLQSKFADIQGAAMSMIMDFVDSVLSTVLSFSFPTICIDYMVA